MDQILTFYIASHGDNIHRVRALAKRLIERGMRWHGNWDWTQHYHKEESLDKVIFDLEGAIKANHFIFIGSVVPSIGANREWGARWGTGGHIWSIGSNHMFDLSTVVTHVRDEDELLERL